MYITKLASAKIYARQLFSDNENIQGDEWFNDGNTHIWITLHDGRTSPMLGVCINGTVTIDWGDGTEPDVLTGTSTENIKLTPNHEYGKTGDYVITLSCDGEMGFNGSGTTYEGAFVLRHTTGADKRNIAYQNAVKKIELGDAVVALNYGAFHTCHSMEAIKIPESVMRVGGDVFRNCYSLKSVTIPSGAYIDGSTHLYHCHTLKFIELPDGMTTIGSYAFEQCYCLTSIDIPESVTSINNDAFAYCSSLLSVRIPKGVTRIESNTFRNCYSVEYYDFTKHTTVPALASTDAFIGIAPNCEIRVQASLYDEWISATNWATYADYIVAV